MAAFLLESLVLRGVSVVIDGKTIGLRLGTSEVAKPQTPENPSMPHSLLGWQDSNPPVNQPAHTPTAYGYAGRSGDGRSRRRAGFPSRCRLARSGSWTVPSGQFPASGGPEQSAVAYRFPQGFRFASAGSEAASRWTATASLTGLQAQDFKSFTCSAGRREVAVALRCKPVSRMPLASMRGK